MGDVYASAVGTTVLQIKEIPPRPQEFDGELCLFGLKAGVDEAAVCQALSDLSTEFESCDLAFESTYGVVRFTTHAAALRAKAANTFSEASTRGTMSARTMAAAMARAGVTATRAAAGARPAPSALHTTLARAKACGVLA